MPLYEYKCLACGHQDDEFFKMSTPTDFNQQCPICQRWQYARQVSLPHTDLKEFHTPIEMQSAGCNSMEEIREMQRAGIECSDDPKSELFGIPIAKNRKEKLKALAVAGLVERK